MLRLVREEDIPLLVSLCQSSPVFGSQALSLWHSFGRQKSCFLQQSSFWLGGPREGPPVYALCHYENHFVAVGAVEGEALVELAEFLNTQPVQSLEGEGQLITALARILGKTPRLSPIMAYSGKGRADPLVRPCREFSSFFNAMAPYCSPAPQKEDWLGRVFPLVQQGYCTLAAICDEQGIVCGAALETAPPSNAAVITSLFTREGCRGRGFAGRMVSHLCAVAQENHKQVFLVCGQPSLASYYRKLGFANAGSRGFISF